MSKVTPPRRQSCDIFCVPCAEQLFTPEKTCPACKTSLDQPDDVVLSSLNPSADYRTSVLAGLSPDIILDITARSLAFWQYQQSQEAAFQAMVLKSAQERNSMLEKRLQSIIVEANSEITLLQEKIRNLESGLSTEKRKTRDLQENVRAVTKECEKLKSHATINERNSLPTRSSAPASTVVHGLSPPRASPTLFWQSQNQHVREPARTMTTRKGARSPPGPAPAAALRKDVTQGRTHPVLNTALEPSLQHNRFTPASQRLSVSRPDGDHASTRSEGENKSRAIAAGASVFGQVPATSSYGQGVTAGLFTPSKRAGSLRSTTQVHPEKRQQSRKSTVATPSASTTGPGLFRFVD